MSSSTLRILGYVAPALSAFAVADSAEAGLLRSALSSFRHSSPVQTVQFGGSNCYYAEGWNGRGWYQCGSEWNYGLVGSAPSTSTPLAPPRAGAIIAMAQSFPIPGR